MQLERQIEGGIASLRPRSAYEAVDFGFLFLRTYYVKLVSIGALVVALPALILSLIFREHTAWVLVLAWWMKPLWERPLLFFVSRALFGDVPTLGETLRSFPEYGWREAVMAISIRRLSPTRSFDLPVTVLEGARGKERGARLGILHRGRFPSGAMALTVLLAHIEMFLFIGMILLVQVMVPEALGWDVLEWAFAIGGEGSLSGQFFVFFVELAAMLLVAPYYVVGGFSLYLHRRTELEAWDLELAFRRLAERVGTRSKRTHGASVAGILIAMMFGLSSLGLPARNAGAEDLTPLAARESIEQILAQEAFHQQETISVPSFILDYELDADEEEDFELPEGLVHFADWLGALLGGGFEILIVSAALGLLGWLIYRIANSQGWLAGAAIKGPGSRGRPTVLFGLEVTEESLPEDLVGEALARAREGHARDALALLYRGALTRLALIYGAELPAGVTESECLKEVVPLLPQGGGEYFAQLTGTWLRCAYGHIDPDPSRLESLCQNWSAWFEKNDGNAPSPNGRLGDSE